MLSDYQVPLYACTQTLTHISDGQEVFLGQFHHSTATTAVKELHEVGEIKDTRYRFVLCSCFSQAQVITNVAHVLCTQDTEYPPLQYDAQYISEEFRTQNFNEEMYVSIQWRKRIYKTLQ